MSKEGAKIISGYKVVAVDTVAAGDSFNGALAVALMEGKGPEAAVRFANANGGVNCSETRRNSLFGTQKCFRKVPAR